MGSQALWLEAGALYQLTPCLRGLWLQPLRHGMAWTQSFSEGPYIEPETVLKVMETPFLHHRDMKSTMPPYLPKGHSGNRRLEG